MIQKGVGVFDCRSSLGILRTFSGLELLVLVLWWLAVYVEHREQSARGKGVQHNCGESVSEATDGSCRIEKNRLAPSKDTYDACL